MAQKITATLVDDIDPELEAAERVKFGLDGVDFEIDLTADHAEELRKAFADYVAAGRRTGGRLQGKTAGRPSREANPKAVRAWALAQGLTISGQGRIPTAIMDRYREATSSQPSASAAPPARSVKPSAAKKGASRPAQH